MHRTHRLSQAYCRAYNRWICDWCSDGEGRLIPTAQDLGVPLAIHPTFEPQWTKGTRMGGWENVRKLRLSASVQASDGVRHQFTTLFDHGVCDRFPRLKVLVLESGGGGIGYMLDRMDAAFSHTPIDELAGLIPDGGRRRFLGDNARELFQIAA
jgi:predicted TIM-barrel fold metal-dependent hydrolase